MSSGLALFTVAQLSNELLKQGRIRFVVSGTFSDRHGLLFPQNRCQRQWAWKAESTEETRSDCLTFQNFRPESWGRGWYFMWCGIKASRVSVYFYGCASWYLFHFLRKLSAQLVLHNKSLHPEANWFSVDLSDCSVWLCLLFTLMCIKCFALVSLVQSLQWHLDKWRI